MRRGNGRAHQAEALDWSRQRDMAMMKAMSLASMLLSCACVTRPEDEVARAFSVKGPVSCVETHINATASCIALQTGEIYVCSSYAASEHQRCVPVETVVKLWAGYRPMQEKQ